MDKPKILIVDDDPDVQDVLITVLSTKNYELKSAYNGEEGLQKVKEEIPDLIILDLLMPKKDGFAVIKDLREDANLPRIPILILTSVKKEASERRYELETGLSLDVDDYIEKPIKPQDLLHRVEKILGRKL